jgi:uracil-DNA glycosylase
VNPSAVVLVGAQPLFHLFALSLRTNRGKVLAWERHGDVPTIPTWHPAGILRSGEASRMKELRADLRQAATIARDILPF